MTQADRDQKNIFKQIFQDGWEDFKQKYARYEGVDEVVQKMLGCGDPANGYSVYICPACHERHVVAFSCKSSFCLSCARAYGEQWAEKVKGMLHPGVTYRQLILTVPEGLRTLIYQNAGALLDGMMKAAQIAMDAAVAVAKRKPVRLGYIVVLQTAGRSGKYNPHLHVLMTDGGLTEEGQWERLGYIPYDLIHRQWQQQVLAMIEERMVGDGAAMALVAKMRRGYPRGFVAHLQSDALPRLGQLMRYIVKYVVSPPMALSRIVNYDREQGTVTYWYRDHLSQQKQTATVSRETFIGRMVQHILPKGFQRIRYYGLQATCILKKVRHQIMRALQGVVQLVMAGFEAIKLTYRERMQQAFGRDPLKCPRCGTEMWLWSIWHPDYGVIYDELERIQAGIYERNERPPPESDRTGDVGIGQRPCNLQLPLPALSV
jgi:hypothetical protein